MKLLLLGATGGIGLELVKQAVEHGHHVTALVRSPERLKPLAAKLTITRGDLLNPVDLERVLHSQDAVLSGFGPRLPIAPNETDLLERFAAVLVPTMLRTAVPRLITVSTAFLFKNAILPPAHLVGRLFFPTVVADASRMEDIIARSALDWTIVRPPRLTDKPYTGKFRARTSHLPSFGFFISRADVAGFMLSAMETRSWSRKIVGVCR